MSANIDRAEELARRDRAAILHPKLPAAKTERVVFTHGSGMVLTDASGDEYLDATGGLWLTQVGHGRPELAEAAAAQMKKLEYFTSFWEFSNEPAIELAERLVEISPAGLDKVFYTSGGSEGDDTAVKMARLYHHRRGDTSRTWILSRRNGYHGLAYGGGSATGFDFFHTGFGPMLPHVEHLTPTWPYRQDLFGGQDPTDFLVAELEATISRIGAENIAAMIAEPVMGVGGVLIPPADYWPRVSEVLKANGILLIFDEVVTAYGRVGTWFASEQFGVTPDIVVTAKGITSGYIQLGAVLTSNQVAEIVGSDIGFQHGYTYNGHPVACAVALRNLQIIEDERLRENAVQMGAYIRTQLKRIEDLPVVGDIRQVGLMIGIELVSDKQRRTPLAMPFPTVEDTIRKDSRVITRDLDNTVVLSPPLIIDAATADRVVDGVCAVLERIRPDGTMTPA